MSDLKRMWNFPAEHLIERLLSCGNHAEVVFGDMGYVLNFLPRKIFQAPPPLSMREEQIWNTDFTTFIFTVTLFRHNLSGTH